MKRWQHIDNNFFETKNVGRIIIHFAEFLSIKSFPHPTSNKSKPVQKRLECISHIKKSFLGLPQSPFE
jgi:hypothetical protein